jgi:hypothetical protein
MLMGYVWLHALHALHTLPVASFEPASISVPNCGSPNPLFTSPASIVLFLQLAGDPGPPL